MNNQLHVYALPTLVAAEELAGATVVVIDVLRASTTIIHALNAGAAEIIPCGEVEQARALAADFPREEVVLGGERGGLPIDGFDLGNSPSEYTPDRVAGRTIVFTTTNGTRAMMRCRKAGRVLIGAFVNASAVAEQLVGCERISLLCAGTEGEYSRDDILMAGLLVDRLQRQSGILYELNAQAMTARENWTSSFAVPYVVGAEPFPPGLLVKELRRSAGGRNLVAVGLEEDMQTAAQIDRFRVLPEMDPDTLHIRASESGPRE